MKIFDDSLSKLVGIVGIFFIAIANIGCNKYSVFKTFLAVVTENGKF